MTQTAQKQAAAHTPRLELVDDGCAEQTVFYHGLRVGGWVPQSGLFREHGHPKATVHLADKRALVIYLISRKGK